MANYGSRLVKVELNSADLGRFLSDSDEVRSAVDSAASDIESALPGAIEDTRSRIKEGGKLKPTFDQVIYREDDNSKDGRARSKVGVKNMSNADFIFGTLPTAVMRSGGRSRRRR